MDRLGPAWTGVWGGHLNHSGPEGGIKYGQMLQRAGNFRGSRKTAFSSVSLREGQYLNRSQVPYIIIINVYTAISDDFRHFMDTELPESTGSIGVKQAAPRWGDQMKRRPLRKP